MLAWVVVSVCQSVCSICCTLCGAEYIGETERPVRERLQEHYRQARSMAPLTPWGAHYKARHPTHDTSAAAFTPFHQAKIIGRRHSLVDRRILEAVLIRQRCPTVNSDCGWRLVDDV